MWQAAIAIIMKYKYQIHIYNISTKKLQLVWLIFYFSLEKILIPTLFVTTEVTQTCILPTLATTTWHNRRIQIEELTRVILLTKHHEKPQGSRSPKPKARVPEFPGSSVNYKNPCIWPSSSCFLIYFIWVFLKNSKSINLWSGFFSKIPKARTVGCRRRSSLPTVLLSPMQWIWTWGLSRSRRFSTSCRWPPLCQFRGPIPEILAPCFCLTTLSFSTNRQALSLYNFF